jgi:hypothetical protein
MLNAIFKRFPSLLTVVHVRIINHSWLILQGFDDRGIHLNVAYLPDFDLVIIFNLQSTFSHFKQRSSDFLIPECKATKTSGWYSLGRIANSLISSSSVRYRTRSSYSFDNLTFLKGFLSIFSFPIANINAAFSQIAVDRRHRMSTHLRLLAIRGGFAFCKLKTCVVDIFFTIDFAGLSPSRSFHHLEPKGFLVFMPEY